MKEHMKSLLIVAGEASGDTHGAALVRELLRREPSLHIAGLGGPKMAAAGVELFHDLTHHAVIAAMGLLENFGALCRARRTITHKLSTSPRPDAIILIDFPDFNLMIAKHAKRVGVPVIYYVSPQIWAARPGRIVKIAERVRKMLVFFEFEKEIYERAGVDVSFVGHPLLDTMADALAAADSAPRSSSQSTSRAAMRRSLGLESESGTLIGLVPGSRRNEIEHVFPLLLQSAEIMQREKKDLTFVTARAEWLPGKQFDRIAARHNVKFKTVSGRTYDVMLASDLLLICSGTATLEAGLLGTPMVVAYTGALLSYMIFGPLVKPGNYALANIAAGERIVPEFYMIDAEPKKIAAAALDLLDGKLLETRRRLGVIREKLGQPGASARAAEEILKTIC